MPDSRTSDEQSRRTIREELLTNILVEAGAGSGKTQMLAERMAAGVAEGVYQIEHMAAVTFTRKAASELRGRFHLALEARLVSARNAKSPKDEILRLQSALSNLERFFAGTIHSFCARLLRERPVESGVSPGFRSPRRRAMPPNPILGKSQASPTRTSSGSTMWYAGMAWTPACHIRSVFLSVANLQEQRVARQEFLARDDVSLEVDRSRSSRLNARRSRDTTSASARAAESLGRVSGMDMPLRDPRA
jgi:superfamily I DNA/RNA helicase